MTSVAAHGGVRADKGKSGLGVLLGHVGDDPGLGRVASLAQRPEFCTMDIRMTIHALCPFARKSQGGVTGSAFDKRVLTHKNKARRFMIKPPGRRHLFPGRGRMAISAFDLNGPVWRLLSKCLRDRQHRDH